MTSMESHTEKTRKPYDTKQIGGIKKGRTVKFEGGDPIQWGAYGCGDDPKELVKDNLYTVSDVSVGDWKSTLSLVGVKGKFNTVMFTPIDPAPTQPEEYYVHDSSLGTYSKASQPEPTGPDPDKYVGYCPVCNQVIKTNIQGNEIGKHECIENSIPEWIVKYDKANYTSGAGKAVRFLIERTAALEKHKADSIELVRELRDALKQCLEDSITRCKAIGLDPTKYSVTINGDAALTRANDLLTKHSKS